MQNLLKYFFVLIAAVAFAACSSDDEPQAETEKKPEFHGQIDYDALTQLLTSAESKLFSMSETYRYIKSPNTDFEWVLEPQYWDGEFNPLPYDFAFHNGSVYFEVTPMLGYGGYGNYDNIFKLYWAVYSPGAPKIMLKSNFDFAVGKRDLALLYPRDQYECQIAEASATRLSIYDLHIGDKYSFLYYRSYELAADPGDYFTKAMYFSIWDDFVTHTLDTAEAKFGADYKVDYFSIAELRALYERGALELGAFEP